jgi:hypothetical protein
MAVAIETEPTFRVGIPEELFQGAYFSYRGHNWDIHPDGNRFLMIKPPPGEGGAISATGQRKITIVLNWDEELKQRVPVD